MIIKLHKEFEKNFRRLKPSEKKKFKERRDLFIKDEFHPILNNHALKGKYLGYRSINVAGDLRALYRKYGNTVVFTTVATHSNLYK
ncbi:hypothetical protein A2803_02860 [Candidatus Woesebacteria bacterium RIFCSPHIGHO2_01_FULL_44_21]|uniref:Addiction module toxin RelE n=1 Tax=Candidatus Woesebacteria bacterium RIFCSPHIGHO2_01_FULL_44_21 TaxID=1802503 RepID=A0A1F7YXD9_9BACT|nr:MAG: hypothetical protein A2803_02860 [Candidatus Woesebacteria bacterium RIFCSPHIGHO2_01_FULL_44_21]OGM71312.1 MAG: hypothetical protein A2897_00760 [Candidatus Woesebacteria bacterium RIFCSPLOWO2_01_FULL_44_24b]